MPMINLGRTTMSPVLSEPNFQIVRTTGIMGMGGFQQSTTKTLTFAGTITVASEKDLDIVKQGDRPRGAMAIYTPSPIYTTEPQGSSPAMFSDVLLWQNEKFRIIAVKQWVDFGYFLGICVRLGGQV